ncbi:hypothetical protein BJX96DRAFT_78254 [Aspergillus floccosus]
MLNPQSPSTIIHHHHRHPSLRSLSLSLLFSLSPLFLFLSSLFLFWIPFLGSRLSLPSSSLFFFLLLPLHRIPSTPNSPPSLVFFFPPSISPYTYTSPSTIGHFRPLSIHFRFLSLAIPLFDSSCSYIYINIFLGTDPVGSDHSVSPHLLPSHHQFSPPQLIHPTVFRKIYPPLFSPSSDYRKGKKASEKRDNCRI